MNTRGISVFNTANELYYAAYQILLEQVAQKAGAVNLALATGNTMIPLYHILTENEEALKIHQWNCFNLDEYYPLQNSQDRISFQHYMEQFFYSKLKKKTHSKNFLNGIAPDPTAECMRYEESIRRLGGIDICILGLGQNGHIGFNEPGTEPTARTHLVQLHADTLLANFKNQTPPVTQALTMGIDSILESRNILIIALGKSKAAAVRAAIEEPTTRTCPASFLQEHYAVNWLLDREAASLLASH